MLYHDTHGIHLFRYKSWKRRWFILNDNCLYYFEYTTDKEPRGIIPLENISVNLFLLMKVLCIFERWIICAYRCEKFKIETSPIASNCTLVVVLTSSKHAKQTLKERWVQSVEPVILTIVSQTVAKLRILMRWICISLRNIQH